MTSLGLERTALPWQDLNKRVVLSSFCDIPFQASHPAPVSMPCLRRENCNNSIDMSHFLFSPINYCKSATMLSCFWANDVGDWDVGLGCPAFTRRPQWKSQIVFCCVLSKWWAFKKIFFQIECDKRWSSFLLVYRCYQAYDFFVCLTRSPQEWRISNFSCSLTRNIASQDEELGFS